MKGKCVCTKMEGSMCYCYLFLYEVKGVKISWRDYERPPLSETRLESSQEDIELYLPMTSRSVETVHNIK